MEEIRRVEDNELCGHVAQHDDQWLALTVFGAPIGDHDDRPSAVEQVLSEGLASLAERWTLRDGNTGAEELVCILEANSAQVTVARGYYALPGVPVLTVSTQQLTSGEWALLR